MREQTGDHGPLGAKVVYYERADDGTGHVEQVDHDIPSEDDVERVRIADDGVDYRGRIDTERIPERDRLSCPHKKFANQNRRT